MIDKIKNDVFFSKFIKDCCCENDVCATIDPEISSDNYVIIKPDDYYNGCTTKGVDAYLKVY